MSDSKVRKGVRKRKDGRTNVHDEERSSRLSVINDDLMQAVETKIRVPRLLTAENKEKRFAISLDYLIRYEEEGDDMLSQIVTGDETWLSQYHPGIKATVYEIVAHILSRQDQSQTKAVKAQYCGNNVLG
ncbi:hypothetical protein TNCV_419201 [Trichonephila clavipes]|uniref:Uncharacterized protein n=1 Tax=Trichonephila clavipes TaxID=2585209 RepID=A0A8X6S0N0_TRICX|nr:hypothetical protein TNCV_419201 [Trichonephila clavipes]